MEDFQGLLHRLTFNGHSANLAQAYNKNGEAKKWYYRSGRKGRQFTNQNLQTADVHRGEIPITGPRQNLHFEFSTDSPAFSLFRRKTGYDITELVPRWCSVTGETEDFVCATFESLIPLGFVNFRRLRGEKFSVDFLKPAIATIICLFSSGTDQSQTEFYFIFFREGRAEGACGSEMGIQQSNSSLFVAINLL